MDRKLAEPHRRDGTAVGAGQPRAARATAAAHPAAARLLALQRQAGNRATSGLLAEVRERQGTTAPPGVVQRDGPSFDLEQATPEQQAELERRGIHLPGASAAGSDPRRHGDYIDNRVTAVGYGIFLGGYLVYCDGLPVPVFVPEEEVAFGQAAADTPDTAIYPTRAEAVGATPYGPPAPGRGPAVAFYRGAGGAVVAPTVLSAATTPRFVECALRARRELADQVQRELVVLAVTLVAGMALRALLDRVARIGGGDPEPPPRLDFATSGEEFGVRMAQEMQQAGYRGNPFREFMRRLNALPRRLPPQEAAEAIRVATPRFNSRMGTMPPVQVGDVLVVPSRAPIPNAPVMGVRADGTVIMGSVPRIEIVHTPAGVPAIPFQVRLHGDITWE